jgi:hypothetical protein
MYLPLPQPTWRERLCASARTLAVIFLTALLASALTVRWSDAGATAVTPLTADDAATAGTVPVTVDGTIVGAGGGLVALVERGSSSPVAFTVGERSQLLRGGEPVALDALRVGDVVNLTLDGRSGEVMRLQAASAGPVFVVPGAAALLAAVGLIAGAALLAIRNLDRLPAFPVRLSSPRLRLAVAR